MFNGRELRKLFEQFNEQYFGGRLPAYKIRVVTHMTRLGESGCCVKTRKLIEIVKGLPNKDATSCLLHEMAHAATNGHHGMPWRKEMIRLRDAGAPLFGPDLTIDLDDWSSEYVSKRGFRSVVQDALADAGPDVTVSNLIRHFITTEGGAPTISAFLKRNPWARKMIDHRPKEGACRIRSPT
jgi:hypothetical protein